MARKRREEKSPEIINLSQPDRSGPTQDTLLQWAEERKLFVEADRRSEKRPKPKHGDDEDEDEDEQEQEEVGLSPRTERILETLLWTVSLAIMHGTLDLLVQHQYAIDVEWPKIATRTSQAFLLFLFLFYILHPHNSSPTLVPGLPARYQSPLRQGIFFASSVASGCHLIYITNTFGYIAILKRAPTLASLWLWSVVELDLGMATGSLLCAVGYLWYGGYEIK